MNISQISTPLLKQRKVLQVDYFTSKLIQTSRDNFQGWDDAIKVSKQQEKLSRYFQSEQTHNRKYYRFKKIVNEKYFGKDLPESYRNTTISQTLKGDQYLYSPRFQKLTSSLMTDSIPMDNSVNDFITNYDNFKAIFSQSQSKIAPSLNITKSNYSARKNTKSICRYSPLFDNFSVILQQQDQLPLKPRKGRQTSTAFNRSVGKGVQKTFLTMKASLMSQQVTLQSERVRKIVRKSLNPEQNSRNIRNRLYTLSEKNRSNQKYSKKQHSSILDIVGKQKLMKFLRESRSIDPKRKGIFSLQDLTDFQKFHLSFMKYMKLKTRIQIDKYAFQNKVKQKNRNIEKFQNLILEQFPMDSDSKRKLEKIFENIMWEFKMAQRRKQAEKR